MQGAGLSVPAPDVFCVCVRVFRCDRPFRAFLFRFVCLYTYAPPSIIGLAVAALHFALGFELTICCPDTRRNDARTRISTLRTYNFIPISTPADPHRHIYGLYGVWVWITTLDVYVVCVFVCVCVCAVVSCSFRRVRVL